MYDPRSVQVLKQLLKLAYAPPAGQPGMGGGMGGMGGMGGEIPPEMLAALMGGGAPGGAPGGDPMAGMPPDMAGMPPDTAGMLGMGPEGGEVPPPETPPTAGEVSDIAPDQELGTSGVTALQSAVAILREGLKQLEKAVETISGGNATEGSPNQVGMTGGTEVPKAASYEEIDIIDLLRNL